MITALDDWALLNGSNSHSRDFHTNAVLFRRLFWTIADKLRPDLRGLCCSHLRRRSSQKFELSDALGRPLLAEVDVTQENRFVGCFFLAEEGNDVGNVGHVVPPSISAMGKLTDRHSSQSRNQSPARSSQSYSLDRHTGNFRLEPQTEVHIATTTNIKVHLPLTELR